MLKLSIRNLLALLSVSIATVFGTSAHAESRAALERSSRAALNTLIAQNAIAKELSTKATAFYNTGGASFGFQAGAQEYGYAMFFMKEEAINALNVAQGFEVGVGPSIVVVDQGMGNSTTTTTLQKDIYAFIFSQKGLMAGIGIQGNKITKINK